MKAFITLLILSVSATIAFCQPPVYCFVDMYTVDEVDTCMLIAQQVCGDAVSTAGGCSDVRPFDANGDWITCEQACSDCINCVGAIGDPCCVYNWWAHSYDPCLTYCAQFYP